MCLYTPCYKFWANSAGDNLMTFFYASGLCIKKNTKKHKKKKTKKNKTKKTKKQKTKKKQQQQKNAFPWYLLLLCLVKDKTKRMTNIEIWMGSLILAGKVEPRYLDLAYLE